MRFRIVDLLLATAVIAVGCTAVMSRDARWPWVFSQVTAATLGYAALHVMYSRLTRPFWIGYLVFGVGRLIATATMPIATVAMPNPEREALERFAIFIGVRWFSSDTHVALSCFATLLIATLGGVISVLVARGYNSSHEKTGPS